MKREYETPCVEIVKFQYSDQVVAESGCKVTSGNAGDGTCSNWEITGYTN